MLTAEQLREIRERVRTIKSITISCDVLDLLADRAEIRQELERIWQMIPNTGGGPAEWAITALIERMKA